jgi:uncharacterized protein YjbI with pentapeptide repeats
MVIVYMGWNDLGGNDLGWNDLGWNDLGWNDLGWNDLGWNDLGGNDLGGNDLGGNDVGGNDVGCTGSNLIDTANLDDMAADGLLFDQAYANASNCAPSRACLMSGEYTSRYETFSTQKLL